MVTWPSSLPDSPLIDGFDEAAPDALLRTQMEVGPAKVRRRTTAAIRPLRLRYVLTRDQVETLDAFYWTTLGGGAQPFDLQHPRTLQTVTCRFTAPPRYQPYKSGVVWIAAVELEVLP